MLYTRYWIATGIIGCYEFTRGFRAMYQFDKKDKKYIQHTYLIADRLAYGVLNGGLYMLPGWNIIAFIRMMNRIEIEVRHLEKTSFPDNYTGILGRYCPYTL